MSEEEFTACLIARGLTVADFDRYTYGMLINYARGYDRIQRISRGEEVPDEEAQYQKLKSIEELVAQRWAAGELTEQEYRDYRRSIDGYEGG